MVTESVSFTSLGISLSYIKRRTWTGMVRSFLLVTKCEMLKCVLEANHTFWKNFFYSSKHITFFLLHPSKFPLTETGMCITLTCTLPFDSWEDNESKMLWKLAASQDAEENLTLWFGHYTREVRGETKFFLLSNWNYLDMGLVALPSLGKRIYIASILCTVHHVPLIHNYNIFNI